MTKEIWKAVDKYEGLYEISNRGKVRSLPRNNTYGRILQSALDNYGYKIITLSKNSKCQTKTIHRLVAIAFLGLPPKNHQCNHKDGDKTNNNLNNLEWVTQSENAKHASINGLLKPPKGEKHGMAKLKETDVKQIRQRLTNGETGVVLALSYMVSQQTISLIKNKKTWGWLN